MAGGLGTLHLRTLPTSRQGRWVAPFGLGTAISVGEARRLLRLIVRHLHGDSPERIRVRQLLRAELDLLVLEPPETPLSVEQATDLGIVSAEAEQVA